MSACALLAAARRPWAAVGHQLARCSASHALLTVHPASCSWNNKHMLSFASCAAPARCASSSPLSSSSAPARTPANAAAPSQQGPIGIEPVKGVLKTPVTKKADDKCGDPLQDDDEEDMVPMIDPKTNEWGGPTKGGVMPEPTRFGDWERKGRCTDFV